MNSPSPHAQHSVPVDDGVLSRAQGCLLGQLAGDSLGSLVEFKSREQILALYPNGITRLENGGTWHTLAGQPTDDSEMALALARSLVEHQGFNPQAVHLSYCDWVMSGPFDIGHTTFPGLGGELKHDSQANGSLMRISPLGILGWQHPPETVGAWARQDAALTHPNKVCLDATALFAQAIAHVVKTGCTPQALYSLMLDWARDARVDATVMNTLMMAAERRPDDYYTQQGWVLIAFQNAVWQMLHSDSAESGTIDSVMQGGDTDTNAAISGALLGAVHGKASLPKQWIDAILNCRPSRDNPLATRIRPECYWPTDALQLAEALVRANPTETQSLRIMVASGVDE